jgi:hypothetical protein
MDIFVLRGVLESGEVQTHRCPLMSLNESLNPTQTMLLISAYTNTMLIIVSWQYWSHVEPRLMFYFDLAGKYQSASRNRLATGLEIGVFMASALNFERDYPNISAIRAFLDIKM